MKIKNESNLLLLLMGSFSCPILACLPPCEEKFEPAELVIYFEPMWSKKDIPENRKGSVTANFDLSDTGKPMNVRILKKTPEKLSESKLTSSIQMAKFTVEKIECSKKARKINKNITHTFELTFENVH
jgi:hypothetical protein